MATTSRYLGIYLNDHLAGSSGGVELARRATRGIGDADHAATLRAIAAEVADDRSALIDIMKALGVPRSAYKSAGGWLAEKAGRLKLNGHVLSRSPLSSLIELETLRLGVLGKESCWQMLIQLASTDARIDEPQVTELVRRARSQAERLETVRLEVGRAALVH